MGRQRWSPCHALSLGLLLLAAPAWATLACDGVDDGLTTSGVSLGTTVTIAGWIFPQAYTNWSVVLANSSCTQGWYMASWLDQARYDTPGASLQAPTAYTENVWHHFAAVVAGGAGVWYFDGVPNGTATGLTTVTASQVCNDPCSEVLHAVLAELQVFSTALSAGEVQALAASRMHYVGISQPQSAYWVFDQCADGASGNGIGFVDRSGNGNTLTADDGGNNAGLTCGGTFAYPWGAH